MVNKQAASLAAGSDAQQPGLFDIDQSAAGSVVKEVEPDPWADDDELLDWYRQNSRALARGVR